MIATPDGAAVWDGNEIHYIDAPDRSMLPPGNAHETLWRAYYRNVCNVARINATVIQREMPQRYWRHLPEAGELPALLHEGGAHSQGEAKECQAPLPRAMVDALEKIVQPMRNARCSAPRSPSSSPGTRQIHPARLRARRETATRD